MNHRETKEIASVLKLDYVMNNARAHWIDSEGNTHKHAYVHITDN